MHVSPLVSVIIPAYNHEKYIQEAIDSIINQTYQNIELLIIDDGSKDATFEKMLEKKQLCEKRFVNVQMLTQENSGTCTTLNRFLELINGEFFYLIASDDIAKKEAIEKEVAFLSQAPDYVLVVGDNEFIDGTSKRIGWDEQQNSVELSKAHYKTFGDFLEKNCKCGALNSSQFGTYENLIKTNHIPNGYLCRTQTVRQIGGFTPEAPLEDYYLMLQLAKKGKMKFLDDILFSYRWHSNNTVKRADYMNKITFKTKSHEKQIVNQPGNEVWKKIYDDNNTKIRFKIGNIIKYYKVKDLGNKKTILEIFGVKIIIKEKNLPL